jgi:hypothetical protein
MLRRRQEKIARHKLRRAAKRRVLRDAPKLETAFAAAVQDKLADINEADAAAAMLTELQAKAADRERGPDRHAETWKPVTRIDGRWYLTYRGHALRVATIGLLLLAALIVAAAHPLGGGVAMAATVIAFRTPAVGSVLALLGLFPVTRYGAKGDGATDNAPAFISAITAANAAGGGDVVVPKATSAYMLQGDQVLIKPNTNIVGVGRPTIKLIGGASVNPAMFRSQAGLGNWGVRGLILDGNQSAVTSVSGTNGAITIGRNNTDVWIVDNEIANTPNAFVTTGAYVAGDTGILRVRLLNNNMHDAVGAGNKNGVYAEAWKDSLIVGNRIVNSYDDNMALISSGVDALTASSRSTPATPARSRRTSSSTATTTGAASTTAPTTGGPTTATRSAPSVSVPARATAASLTTSSAPTTTSRHGWTGPRVPSGSTWKRRARRSRTTRS